MQTNIRISYLYPYRGYTFFGAIQRFNPIRRVRSAPRWLVRSAAQRARRIEPNRLIELNRRFELHRRMELDRRVWYIL